MYTITTFEQITELARRSGADLDRAEREAQEYLEDNTATDEEVAAMLDKYLSDEVTEP